MEDLQITFVLAAAISITYYGGLRKAAWLMSLWDVFKFED
jgi:hypothetical protein